MSLQLRSGHASRPSARDRRRHVRKCLPGPSAVTIRVLKSDLEIAPVYHRLPERIRAHALICFLALVLYRVMRMRLKAHGSSASPKTALELLRRIRKYRATIGEHTYAGISKTTQEQLDLFAALGLVGRAPDKSVTYAFNCGPAGSVESMTCTVGVCNLVS